MKTLFTRLGFWALCLALFVLVARSTFGHLHSTVGYLSGATIVAFFVWRMRRDQKGLHLLITAMAFGALEGLLWWLACRERAGGLGYGGNAVGLFFVPPLGVLLFGIGRDLFEAFTTEEAHNVQK